MSWMARSEIHPLTWASVQARRAALRDSDRTHCPAGHELTPDNLKVSAQGTRSCRQCHRDYHREYQRNWKAVGNG